jgi:amino acid transporter
MADKNEAGANRNGFLAAMSTVFWSFFGVRKQADHDRDAVKLEPYHFIIAGVVGAAIFVGILLLVVHMVVK